MYLSHGQQLDEINRPAQYQYLKYKLTKYPFTGLFVRIVLQYICTPASQVKSFWSALLHDHWEEEWIRNRWLGMRGLLWIGRPYVRTNKPDQPARDLGDPAVLTQDTNRSLSVLGKRPQPHLPSKDLEMCQNNIHQNSIINMSLTIFAAHVMIKKSIQQK